MTMLLGCAIAFAVGAVFHANGARVFALVPMGAIVLAGCDTWLNGALFFAAMQVGYVADLALVAFATPKDAQ